MLTLTPPSVHPTHTSTLTSHFHPHRLPCRHNRSLLPPPRAALQLGTRASPSCLAISRTSMPPPTCFHLKDEHASDRIYLGGKLGPFSGSPSRELRPQLRPRLCHELHASALCSRRGRGVPPRQAGNTPLVHSSTARPHGGRPCAALGPSLSVGVRHATAMASSTPLGLQVRAQCVSGPLDLTPLTCIRLPAPCLASSLLASQRHSTGTPLCSQSGPKAHRPCLGPNVRHKARNGTARATLIEPARHAVGHL